MSTTTEHEDPRRARSRARVLEAAVAILGEDGQPGLTIEAVAARSGVAKTTIYRQFADRDELHVAAVHSVAPTMPMPTTDDLQADVTIGKGDYQLKVALYQLFSSTAVAAL